jgi:ribbon-helix-helix protein
MGPQKANKPITRISVFLTEGQLDALRSLNRETGIPVSVLIRQGVDRIISEHRNAKRRAKR